MMNERLLTCDEFGNALADFLERDLPEDQQADMERHALTCPDCGPLLADLRRLRIDAANLETLTPRRDLWQGIAERIETPVVAIGAGSNAPAVAGRRSLVARRAWLGLAAAGIVGVTTTIAYQAGRHAMDVASDAVASAVEPWLRGATPGPVAAPLAAPAAAPSGTLASNRLSPEATYDLEIEHLRAAVDARRGNLDSNTIAVLEKNLRIIDEAIAQCRQALAADPQSAYLNATLTDALDDKVRLLRTAATLPTTL